MFASRLQKSGERCEAVVISREPTATSSGSPDSPLTMKRIWAIELEVRPGGGRAPFRITERMAMTGSNEPWTTGTVVPAWVHPRKDKAYVKLDGTDTLEAALNERLAASGIQVSIPDGVTDPAEVQRILTEQIESQQRAAEAGEGSPQP